MYSRTVKINGSVTTAPADSPWFRLDTWAGGSIGYQAVVSGTVVYSIQTTFDDPNSPTNPVASPTWDSLLTGASSIATSTSGTLSVVPTYIKIRLESGTGSVALTVNQALSVPF